MTLNMIGIGLHDEKDISLKALEIIRKCERIFLESYTSKLHCSTEDLEKLYGKKITLATRDLVEKNAEEILQDAKEKDIAFLVIGDIFSATTHTDIFLRARQQHIPINCVHNASVMNAVGITGLELYKFGKTTSIVYPEGNWKPETPYDVIKQNQSHANHTLVLLDIKAKESTREQLQNNQGKHQPPRYMTVPEAIQILQDIESKRKEGIITQNTLCVGCARLGSPNPTIMVGTPEQLKNADFKEPLHCLIIPGKLHFIEEEALKYYTPTHN